MVYCPSAWQGNGLFTDAETDRYWEVELQAISVVAGETTEP